MSKLFQKDLMEYNSTLNNWKDVVRHGVDLLVKKGCATQELADAIFKSTEEFGAYYVLEKGLALLHAAPGPYALKTATSLILLKDYVTFNNQPDKQAKIIITLSATDSTSHLEILQEFSHYFTNEEFKKEALEAKSLQEFEQLLQKYKF
ncbi:PTS sugar transporter subunit IIA [Mycoplasmopsis ciconiae]|uniref:Ascorbate-specific PTS system EIIA component n=1 Tax=Mycoplasmopsis ciconiae TaxID=561067 RepID=A0ABU7MKW5_9BACT|nr:PTS sugar transporter subunit IIA [Mycoplasmopsis ciconiae]